MKQFAFSLLLAICTRHLAAETISMDLRTAIDISGTPIAYSTSSGDGMYNMIDVWDKTYDDSEA